MFIKDLFGLKQNINALRSWGLENVSQGIKLNIHFSYLEVK
jgi:hypothetical protein